MTSLLTFLNTNINAITSFGILITFIVSAISLYMSIRNNKAVHYVNSITKSRMDWINQLRESVSEFIANTNIHNNAYYQKEYEKSGEHLSKCQKLCTKIKLLLNYCDDKDKEFVELIDRILDSFRGYCDEVHNCELDEQDYFIESSNMIVNKNNVEANIKILTEKIQIYLKSEWNRVKYESMGQMYEKATEKFDYKELNRKYYDSKYKNKVFLRKIINLGAKIKRWVFSFSFIISLLVLIAVIALIILLIYKAIK